MPPVSYVQVNDVQASNLSHYVACVRIEFTTFGPKSVPNTANNACSRLVTLYTGGYDLQMPAQRQSSVYRSAVFTLIWPTANLSALPHCLDLLNHVFP